MGIVRPRSPVGRADQAWAGWEKLRQEGWETVRGWPVALKNAAGGNALDMVPAKRGQIF